VGALPEMGRVFLLALDLSRRRAKVIFCEYINNISSDTKLLKSYVKTDWLNCLICF